MLLVLLVSMSQTTNYNKQNKLFFAQLDLFNQTIESADTEVIEYV